MAKAFVYSVLAALLFAVHSTTAFPLRVNDEMTEAEREVYGLPSWDSSFAIFPMSLSGMEQKRKSRENIHCTLVFGDLRIALNLKPTSQYLATKYTPVWLADSDRHAYNNIRYTPLPTAMSDIGKFTMYHDLKNKAALVVYKDRSEGIVIEGLISFKYIIRSVPKRFINKFENVVTNMSKIPNMMGGAITSYKDTGFYAVRYVGQNAPAIAYYKAILDNAATQKRPKSNKGKRKVPKKIYPEFLLVLDHNAIRYRSITEALRFTLGFWNGMGLLVRSLDKPKVRPNIAGIIIANDYEATPYITENTSVHRHTKGSDIVVKMHQYFYEERYRFPVKQYDLIVAMTTMFLCAAEHGICENSRYISAFGAPSLKCSSERDITKAKAVENTFIMNYDTSLGVPAFFSGWAFIMNTLFSKCVSADGHTLMDDVYTLSKCFKKTYSATFTTKETECYRNKPRSIQPIDKLVPGRWLSMDGQCQNEGFAESCKLNNKIGACKEKGCRSWYSKACFPSIEVPLLGSKCGTNKYCNKKERCVKKL